MQLDKAKLVPTYVPLVGSDCTGCSKVDLEHSITVSWIFLEANQCQVYPSSATASAYNYFHSYDCLKVWLRGGTQAAWEKAATKNVACNDSNTSTIDDDGLEETDQ